MITSRMSELLSVARGPGTLEKHQHLFGAKVQVQAAGRAATATCGGWLLPREMVLGAGTGPVARF